ncbi:hypothetical protein GH714_021345 [Hevea brasiliensis]|uniref:Uncharacterized protein n=1 Tax=Hevea brasiliensis TaxID=3981 RepID=A0A6A6LCK1_HEVBR|nr:hypothetical protein GH714_021345 [Hevea brasiliensis]
MDKKWIQCTDGLSGEYVKGVEEFIDFAFAHTEVEDIIPCPSINEFVAQENYNSIVEGQNCYDNMLGMIHDVAEPKIMEEIMNDVYEKDRIEDNNIDVEYKVEPSKA